MTWFSLDVDSPTRRRTRTVVAEVLRSLRSSCGKVRMVAMPSAMGPFPADYPECAARRRRSGHIDLNSDDQEADVTRLAGWARLGCRSAG